MNVESFFTADNRCAENSNTADILTMAFVNIQPFDKVYSLSDAFEAGTLFPALNKPFFGGGRKK